MRRPFLLAKVHRVIVTEADLDYEGSLTLDEDLLDAAGLLPFQKVEIYNVTRGTRLSTYLIAGPRGGGDCCANGAAAHLCRPGDRVILAAYADLDDEEVARHRPRIVLVGEDNRDWRVVGTETPFRRSAG
ncbi:MAG: aspartate 1-decarboxylase [Acidobacteria bacterium]|nr:MAG: aspartate 1-decarboxylase [Acidobacteriota bacterium]